MKKLKSYHLLCSINLILVCFILISVCKKDKGFVPEKCKYNSLVQVEDTVIMHCTKASLNSVFSLGISFSYYKENNLKYELGIGVPPNLIFSDSIPLHSYYNKVTATTEYSELCCANFPDQSNFTYYIYEQDSINNYLKLHIDTINKKIYGNFQGTYTAGPNDNIHIKCSYFECRYNE